MEIGEIVEIGEREVVVSPRRETPDPAPPQRAPVQAPEREEQPA